MKPYTVYVRTDEQNCITAVDSSAFLRETEGWAAIDRGRGDRFFHAQGNYFAKPLRDERGVCRYRLTDGAPAERAPEEMDEDAALHAAGESDEVLLLEVAADHEYRICLLELGMNESEEMENDV